MQLVAVVFFGLVLATSQASSAVVERRSALGVLLPRQDPTTTVCASTCAPFEASLETCTTIACFCTSAVSASLQACINCALNADPTITAITDARTVLNEYDAVCIGVQLPIVTIPNIIASATLSSSAGGATVSDTAIFPIGTSFSQQTIRSTSTTLIGTTGPSTTTQTNSPGGVAGGLVGGSSTFRNGAVAPLLISVGAIIGVNLL